MVLCKPSFVAKKLRVHNGSNLPLRLDAHVSLVAHLNLLSLYPEPSSCILNPKSLSPGLYAAKPRPLSTSSGSAPGCSSPGKQSTDQQASAQGLC